MIIGPSAFIDSVTVWEKQLKTTVSEFGHETGCPTVKY